MERKSDTNEIKEKHKRWVFSVVEDSGFTEPQVILANRFYIVIILIGMFFLYYNQFYHLLEIKHIIGIVLILFGCLKLAYYVGYFRGFDFGYNSGWDAGREQYTNEVFKELKFNKRYLNELAEIRENLPEKISDIYCGEDEE